MQQFQISGMGEPESTFYRYVAQRPNAGGADSFGGANCNFEQAGFSILLRSHIHSDAKWSR
jgi:hypothetical protein